MDRFLTLAAEYGAPFTIFVIGQDIENNENAEAVARWHALGHEIGNHSYSHRQDLYRLSENQVAEEIGRAHEIIKNVTGVNPVGFTAPGWASCTSIIKTLNQMGYLYDTSLAPTWLFLLAQVALRLKSRSARELIPWLRSDWRGNLSGFRQPYFPSLTDYLKVEQSSNEKGTLMLPLPSVKLFRLGMWHTLSFSHPDWLFKWLLKKSVQDSEAFYYVLHPADLTDPDKDLTGLPSSLKNIQRMCIPLQEKERKIRIAFDQLSRQGHFVTMSQIAESYVSRRVEQSLPLEELPISPQL